MKSIDAHISMSVPPAASSKMALNYRSVVDRQGLSPPFPRALPLVLRIGLGRIDQRRGQIHLRLEQCTLIERCLQVIGLCRQADEQSEFPDRRSEEHTSELQSQSNLVCRLLLEKKNSKHSLSSPTTAPSSESRLSNGSTSGSRTSTSRGPSCADRPSPT